MKTPLERRGLERTLREVLDGEGMVKRFREDPAFHTFVKRIAEHAIAITVDEGKHDPLPIGTSCERLCFECGGTMGVCAQARIKCCPDCTHYYPATAVIVPGAEMKKQGWFHADKLAL